MKITTIGTYYNSDIFGIIKVIGIENGVVNIEYNHNGNTPLMRAYVKELDLTLINIDHYWLDKFGFFHKPLPFITRTNTYYNKKWPIFEIKEHYMFKGYMCTFPYNSIVQYVHELQIFFQLATQENLEIQ